MNQFDVKSLDLTDKMHLGISSLCNLVFGLLEFYDLLDKQKDGFKI